MKNYDEWKKEYISEETTRKYMTDKDIRKVYEEKRKAIEEEKKFKEDEEKKRVEMLRMKAPDLFRKINSEGFRGLNVEDIEAVSLILEDVLNSRTRSEEKFNLIKAVLNDNQAYRFFTLRLSERSTIQQQAMLEAMNLNLSQISNKTSGVKAASMFTGMAAARHLGEQMAEDFGGED